MSAEIAGNASAWRREEIEDLYRRIDTLDPEALQPRMAADAEFTFGNRPAMVGHEEIREGNAHFFELIKGMRHRLSGIWDVGETTMVRAQVTYTRLDGDEVTIPTLTVIESEDELIRRWTVYFDVAPVFA